MAEHPKTQMGEDEGEYRPVLDQDFKDGTAPAAPAARPAAEPAVGPGHTAHPAQGAEPKPGVTAAPGTVTPAPQGGAKPEIRYVKKEPSAVGRWFLRNLFSLLVLLVLAAFVVSNLAMPSYAAPLPQPGFLSLRFLGLEVSGPTWLFLVIMAGAGFFAGLFFLRRLKVREKKNAKA